MRSMEVLHAIGSLSAVRGEVSRAEFRAFVSDALSRQPELQALAWDAAQGLLYATAPRSGSVLVLRPGAPGVRRLASLPKGSGQLSGLALDGQGGLWTALRDGWSVVRLSPEGNLDRVIGLPVSCPTDLCFGGADGSQMYITTARQPVPLDTLANAPLSGRLLVTEP